MYDVTNRDSFNDCDAWLAEAAKFGANPTFEKQPPSFETNRADPVKKRVIETQCPLKERNCRTQHCS